jgi:GNAT superfamily N-acetyltransferase
MDPRNYVAREILKDGTEVTVRAIRSDDKNSLEEVFRSLDQESIYRRFFSPKKELTEAELQQFTDVDFAGVVALVVTVQTERGETLVGGGRYAVTADPAQGAELAFVTEDNYRRRGLASLVLRHLARIGREMGIVQFEADVLAENQPMLSVFRRSGLPMRQRREGNVIHLILALGGEKT